MWGYFLPYSISVQGLQNVRFRFVPPALQIVQLIRHHHLSSKTSCLFGGTFVPSSRDTNSTLSSLLGSSTSFDEVVPRIPYPSTASLSLSSPKFSSSPIPCFPFSKFTEACSSRSLLIGSIFLLPIIATASVKAPLRATLLRIVVSSPKLIHQWFLVPRRLILICCNLFEIKSLIKSWPTKSTSILRANLPPL